MSAAASIAGFMKRHVVGPALIRRNPFYYEKARALITEGDSQDLATRRAWSEERLERTLRQARRSAYGRRVGGGNTLDSWPLLEKESLRDAQKDFIVGNLPPSKCCKNDVPEPPVLPLVLAAMGAVAMVESRRRLRSRGG